MTSLDIPVLLINRDRDVERRAHMAEAVRREGFAFERVTAIEGLNVPADLRAQFLTDDGKPRARLFPGEIGCYASHLTCCRMIVERGLDMALVLEDDVELTPGFAGIVTGALANAGRDWDMLRLSCKPRGAVLSVARIDERHHLVKYLRMPKLAGAQVWSRRGAEKFLIPRARVRPVDADFRYNWEFGLDMLGVYPPPARQEERFASGISTTGISRRKERGGGWQPITLASRLNGMIDRTRHLGVRGTGLCMARVLAAKLTGRGGEVAIVELDGQSR